MSFPGSGLETTYRNNLREVAKMLQTNHQDKYMVRADKHLGHGWGGGGWAIPGLLDSWENFGGISRLCLPRSECVFLELIRRRLHALVVLV